MMRIIKDRFTSLNFEVWVKAVKVVDVRFRFLIKNYLHIYMAIYLYTGNGRFAVDLEFEYVELVS